MLRDTEEEVAAAAAKTNSREKIIQRGSAYITRAANSAKDKHISFCI